MGWVDLLTYMVTRLQNYRTYRLLALFPIIPFWRLKFIWLGWHFWPRTYEVLMVKPYFETIGLILGEQYNKRSYCCPWPLDTLYFLFSLTNLVFSLDKLCSRTFNGLKTCFWLLLNFKMQACWMAFNHLQTYWSLFAFLLWEVLIGLKWNLYGIRTIIRFIFIFTFLWFISLGGEVSSWEMGWKEKNWRLESNGSSSSIDTVSVCL